MITVTVNADGTATEESSGLVVACGWFARCDRPANGVQPHPILGDIPSCQRCADVVSGTLTPWAAL